MRLLNSKDFNEKDYIELQKEFGEKPDWGQCQQCYACIGLLGRVIDRIYRVLTFGFIKHLHKCTEK